MLGYFGNDAGAKYQEDPEVQSENMGGFGIRWRFSLIWAYFFLYILGLYEGNEFNWGGVKLGNLLNTSIERPIGLGCNMRHAAVVLWHPMHLCSEGDTVRCFWLCDLAHIRFRSSIDLWILPITINWPRQQD